ncbi:toprim domain-containing protein [Orientia tsutsugamushi]|uniref:toprim domain-containing protein n=1 Tax=Orientia tsutsugamushi TaxID=784 RepID=UPI000D6500E0|nr:toprim domain-containing protein [Orientia tsutsugamushi]QES95796.1 conjugal transfer protein TraI [Orientia tsutsugamushi]
MTIIAEGAETALSLQQSGIKGNIIASAGISNLRNYSPFPGEKIIIAADNDSKNTITNTITNNTVIKAAKTLEMKGAITCIVKPPENGDFNNLLQSCGDQSIRDIIEPEITKLTKAVETTKLTQTENNSIEKQNNITNVKELYNKYSKYSPVTIITKDIETALTIRQAGVEGKILCAIEAENLQNYNPGPKEKIILAVKNDVNTEKAEKVLEDKGAVVCTVKNDFNNVLKTQGLYAVRNIISPEIRKLNEKIESIQTNIQPGLCPKH